MNKLFKQKIVNLSKRLIPHEIRIFLRKLNWKKLYYQQLLFSNHLKSEFYCPIAKKEFKLFIKIRDNLLTPSNGANSRQRLVWLYLENELNILSKEYVLLHIAPELSYYDILSKCDNLFYIPGDKMTPGYSNQRGVQNINLTNLKFNDNFFDIIICNHVLEHIQDHNKAISEMYRVLKKGGIGIITVPINENLNKTYEDPSIITPSERMKHFGQWDHVRWYALDIENIFSKYGFSVEMNRYSRNFSAKEIKRYGLCKSFIIIVHK